MNITFREVFEFSKVHHHEVCSQTAPGTGHAGWGVLVPNPRSFKWYLGSMPAAWMLTGVADQIFHKTDLLSVRLRRIIQQVKLEMKEILLAVDMDFNGAYRGYIVFTIAELKAKQKSHKIIKRLVMEGTSNIT